MKCKHQYRGVKPNGAIRPWFYVCNICNNKVETEDECWYYDEQTNELKREIYF